MDFVDECVCRVDIEVYFLWLCKLYGKKEDLNFFLKFEKDLNIELNCFKKENRELFCVFIILVIFDDNFCMEYL